MSPIETLLAGLIDYAGLYPPASLEMRTAVRNYLDYRSGKHAFALGRFIVDASRLDELSECANGVISDMALSVVASANAPTKAIEEALNRGLPIQSIELKSSEPAVIEDFSKRLPAHLERYFEFPIQSLYSGVIGAIATAGERAKLRMGGITPDAFPPPAHVVDWLRVVADRRIPFKATAGLHHPIRSRHRLTNEPEGLSAIMHGFMNLFCAAALVFNGEATLAGSVLEEDFPQAFRSLPDRLAWLAHEWTAPQIRTVRQRFFTSFGSCSFVEPMQDLEALGWL